MYLKSTLTGLTATTALCLGGAAWGEELRLLTLGGSDAVAIARALTEAYTAQNPDVTFEIETRPGGGEGDNLVKTRLATGEMSDIFAYNTGSLLQALRPDRTLVPLNDLPNYGNISDAYTSVVTDAEGQSYGVPVEAVMSGGIMYNRPLYEELGLEIPATWDQFMANNARIAAESDAAPIVQTYRDVWSAQMLVLSDYFNLQQAVPDFAERYTANDAHFADTPAALRAFEKLQEIFESGYLNADFGAATYEQGLRMIGEGGGAHYPMLSVGLATLMQNNPDLLDNVGFFPQPGDEAGAQGLTIWLPTSYYIPQSSDKIDLARDFLNFAATPEACQAVIAAVGANGPYMIEGCALPEGLPPAVGDIVSYFDREGGTAPALEFLSPVKGPSLEQIAVAVGSGINTAAEGAALYDRDVSNQARQLGLPGW